MRESIPSRRELKLQAKGCMGQAIGACSTLGLAVVAVGMLANAFAQRAGGAVPVYLWYTAEQSIQNSFTLSAEGLYAALRLEEAGLGLSVAVTPAMLLVVLLVQVLAAVVTAPLYLGCLDHLWAIRQGGPRPFRALFVWYTDLRRAGRSILLELILRGARFVLQGLFFLPALWVLWRGAGGEGAFTAALWIILAGQAAAWCLMTQLNPARHLFSRRPEQGLWAALRGTQAMLRGQRGRYLNFCLSFAVWELANLLTRGLMSFYLFPYQGLANMFWIEKHGT